MGCPIRALPDAGDQGCLPPLQDYARISLPAQGWLGHACCRRGRVCKELGIHSKDEIEAFGIEPFIRKCVESVFRYTQHGAIDRAAGLLDPSG